MANSYVEYSSGLTATTYSIPFNYIAIADVNVKGYNGSTWTDLTVASRDNAAKTITLSAAPSSYQKIRVWRNTSTAQLVDFQNGSRLSETDLDTAYQQGLFVAQEVSENASTEVEGVGQQGPQGIQGPAGADGTDPFDSSGNLIVASGNLAVNTTDTDHTLSVNAPNYDGIQLQAGGTDCGYIGVFTNTVYLGGGNTLAFHTGNAGMVNGIERMRIDSSGNIIIANIPTSSSNLPSGAIYSDGGTLKIV